MPAVEAPGAEAWVPEDLTPERLAAAVQECRGCELYRDATRGVMGRGPEHARLMVVGEQPGDQEDRAGEPFVGPAGRLLESCLEDAGMDLADVYVTNVVKHFRFSGTRGRQRIHKSPSRVHVAACEPWLLAELRMVAPEVVVLLGGTAGKAVFGPAFKVGDARGRLAPWPGQVPLESPPTWVLPTTHPSAVLRSRQREADRTALVADLAVAVEALKNW